MRLTVLGASASYPAPGEACAGYLVSGRGKSLLFDCGNGVISNLGRIADPLVLDAVFVTHTHPDHLADVYALQSLLRYAPEGPAPAVPLFGPPDLEARLGCLLSEGGRRELAEAFEFGELVAATPVAVGELTVTPYPADHAPGSFCLVVSSPCGTRLCYTGDSRLGEPLVQAARGCRLLLADATLPERYAGAAPHMTPSEAGALAARAGAERLVLTHLWPTNDRAQALAEARSAFHGEVAVATALDVYKV